MRRPRNASEWLVVTIGSAFGLGLAPIAPGSFAALLGVGFHLVLVVAGVASTWPFLLAAFAVVTALHFILNAAAARYWEDTDSGHFVLDEVAGYLLVATIAAAWVDSYRIMIEGFLLFRVLDIVKVPPARYFDREMHNAAGVLLDDLVAAIYAAAILLAHHCIIFPMYSR